MVDAVYRGNIEELLSVINHLKKYIIVFAIVLLVLISAFHFAKYPHAVPLITVALLLLPATYYSVVLALKFTTVLATSNQPSEVTTMDSNGNRQELKTPDVLYPKSPTPPPSYEEATRNDHHEHHPQLWLPSTSNSVPIGIPPVFNMANVAAKTHNQIETCNDDRTPSTRTMPKIQNIPSVTITLDNDQRSMEI